MSEARALTNFAGNAVAIVLIGSWTREFDADQARRVLDGANPFDETTLLDEPTLPAAAPTEDGSQEPPRSGSALPAYQKGDHP
jgi:aerobic C4-dicarboxylate transport protein